MRPELRRRIYLAIGAAGLIISTGYWITGSGKPWEADYIYPALAGYLAIAMILLLRRPDSLVIVERSGFWAVAIAWLGSMAIGLASVVDDELAWQALSPSVFMNMALLVVLAYLWYETRWALLASLVGPVVSTIIGVIRFSDNAEYVGRLFEYEGYVIVIAAFTYLLARGRDSLLASQIEAERMRILAFEDSLTGLPNRRSVAERLRVVLAEDRSDEPMCVISFDLDDFKSINDTYGHDSGDRLLQDVAAIARRVLPPKVMFGRWGGEEFLVVLPGFHVDRAWEIAESLRTALEEHENDGIRVTASFGVSAVVPGDTVDDVLRSVDEVLYRAKRSGRNIVELAAVIEPRRSDEPPSSARDRTNASWATEATVAPAWNTDA